MPDSSPAPAPARTSGSTAEIAILLATRGRPALLAEVFQSLANNTARKDLVSLWLYVDDDDEIMRTALAQNILPDPGVKVHWHIGPPPGGLGETHKVLWQKAGPTPAVYMITCDDVYYATPDWDDLVRAAAAHHPDGIFLAGPYDPMTADTCTYPLFGWRWLETLNQIVSGRFPYWYDDRWVHQIGHMAGCYYSLPILMSPIGGKGRTRRMRDLPFWARFFQLTLDERKDTARKLIDAMDLDPKSKTAAHQQLEERAAGLEKEQDKFSDLYTVFQEERFTQHTPEERRAFNPGYFKKEADAVAQLMIYAQQRIADKKYAEALKFLDATLMSNLRVRQVQDMKVACLRALGQNAEADQLAKETLLAWPEMNFARRIFRFLGMVASDGKVMITGFLFKSGKKK